MAKRTSTKGQTTIYKTYTEKTKDRVTRTLLITGDGVRCSGSVSSSRRVNQVTNRVTSHEQRRKCSLMIKEETPYIVPKYPHFLAVWTRFETFYFQICC